MQTREIGGGELQHVKTSFATSITQTLEAWEKRPLRLLARLITTYAKTVLVLCLVLAALASLYTVQHLDFVTGRNDLISAKKRYLQLDEEYSKAFHGLDQLIVVAEGPTLEETKAFVRLLGERLKADTEHVQEVFYHIDASSLEGKKLLLLSPTDLRLLRANVEDYQELMRDLTTTPGVNTLLAAVNHKISSVMVSHLTKGFLGLGEPEDKGEKKPLSLSFLKSLLGQMDRTLVSPEFYYRSPWADFFGNDELASGGFLVSDDKRFVYLLVEPRKRGEGFNDRQDSINAVRRHVAELRKPFPRVQAGVTGDTALGNDEMVAAQAGTSTATVLSLIGVTLLYILFFRSIRRPLIIAFTVIVGLTWTMGLLTLTIGHVSILSIFVAPILIGLCDAYGIYFTTRYEEERDLGKPFATALQTTFVSTAPSLVAGAGTTALAFYAMTLADFRGVQELGLIAGSGVLLLLLAALTFLPAVLTLTEGKRRWQKSVRRETWLAQGFAGWGRTVQRFRRPVLLLTAGVSLLCLFVLPTITFDYNLLHLQARGTESVTWELRIIQNAGRSSWYALSTAPSLAEAARKAARFAALPAVEKVETIASLVPERQEERIALVQELAPFFAGLPAALAAPGSVAVGDLKHTLEGIRFKLRGENDAWDLHKKPSEREMAEARGLLTSLLAHLDTLPATQAAVALERLQRPLFQDFADKWSLLRENLNPPGPITLAEVPAQLRTRFVSADGKQFLLQIYPRQDIWEGGPLHEFVSQLRQVDPDVTGNPVIGYESIRAIKNGYMKGGLYAAAVIPLVAFLILRRVSDTLRALLPVVLGMLWTAGFIWLFHLQFNLANVVVVPLIIGVGVDGGINLIRRAREEGCAGWVLVGESTGQAIALYSLDSMAGFGSLMVARHAGIFSMGLLLTLAVGCVLVATLTVLPLLLFQPTPRASEAVPVIPLPQKALSVGSLVPHHQHV